MKPAAERVMIHLDTNFFIQALVPNSAAEAKVLAWLTRKIHTQREMPTGWSAGLQPALGVGKPPSRLQTGAPPEVCEICGLTAGEVLGISTMAWSEFISGPLSPQDEALARLIVDPPEPFVAADASKAAGGFNPKTEEASGAFARSAGWQPALPNNSGSTSVFGFTAWTAG